MNDTESILELLQKIKREQQSSRPKRKQGETKKYSTVRRFIEQYGIKKGIDRVPTYVIYYTYRTKWDGEKKQNKTNKINFFRTFKQYFDMVRTGQGRYYLLDASVFDMTREGRLEAKDYDKKDTKRVKTIREKKKNKVSKSS